MRAYFIKRCLLIVPTFIGVTLLVFIITRFVPGGPIERLISQTQMMQEDKQRSTRNQPGSIALSPDQINSLREFYGFDKPVIVSYLEWLKNVLTFNLGNSTRYNDPVWDIIKSRFPISIYYGFITLILTYIVCIPLGVLKAIKHKTAVDNITSILIFVGYAIPGYILGIGLMLLFASHWEIFPLGGFTSENFYLMTFTEKIIDLIMHTVLPLCAYMAGSFAFMTFLMKNSLMENLASDYMRTAIAKGLDFKTAVLRHAMRNSLIPLATSFGNNISLILAGSFLIETVFNIDGFGLLGYESVVERDYPVVMGILVISSLLQIIGNILSDICVAIVDPRVKF